MDLKKAALIIFYIVGWNITSITAGIYNKEFLDLHGLPVLLTLCQSFMGVICGLVVLGGLSKLQLNLSSLFEFKILILLGLVHCVGTVLTNISTLMSAASFTHTIKVRNPPGALSPLLSRDSSIFHRLQSRCSQYLYPY